MSMANPQDMRSFTAVGASVESFSQLPFIRPAPPMPPPPPQPAAATKESTIRLFGHEFSHEQPAMSPKETAAPSSNDAANNASTVTSESVKNGAAALADRKFECHYCCRNFPTSQALGGHQNAHKRERQHAKRAHLQASLAAAHGRYMPVHGGSHMYGMFGYHHHAGSFEPPPPPPPPPHYPIWTSADHGAGPAADRLYNGLGSAAQPINGSPVPGIWRVSPQVVAPPATVYGQTKDERRVMMSSPSTSSCSSTSPKNMIGRCEMGQQENGVSLDLRL